MQAGGQTPVFVMSMLHPLFSYPVISPFTADTAPERQSGRKAQISNITAAKVCHLFHANLSHFIFLNGLPQDCRRCHTDMSRTKSHAQNDPRSNGRHSVRPPPHPPIMRDLKKINPLQSVSRTMGTRFSARLTSLTLQRRT